MTGSQTSTEKELSQFINEYADDRHCLLELLLFWGRHPCARFSRLAIVHALNSRRPHIERALGYLINKGIVRTCLENNVPLYSLTDNEPLHSLVLNITREYPNP
jgi:hypothetical protein